MQLSLTTPIRAAYVHLPFCRRRCHYCDFPIQVVGSKPGAADAAAEKYCELLLREIRATATSMGSTALAAKAATAGPLRFTAVATNESRRIAGRA